MNSSTSTSETNENVFLLIFISSFVSFGVCIYVCSGKSNFNRKYLPVLMKGRLKVPKKTVRVCSFANVKDRPIK